MLANSLNFLLVNQKFFNLRTKIFRIKQFCQLPNFFPSVQNYINSQAFLQPFSPNYVYTSISFQLIHIFKHKFIKLKAILIAIRFNNSIDRTTRKPLHLFLFQKVIKETPKGIQIQLNFQMKMLENS